MSHDSLNFILNSVCPEMMWQTLNSTSKFQLFMTRKQEKEKTRNHILRMALTEFEKYGYRHSNTARIAKNAGVAHGTIFLHFNTKDQLFFEVIHQRVYQESNRLYAAVQDSNDIEALCRIHLQHISEELAFESMLARELPFLPIQLKRQVFTIRCGIVKYFYDVLTKEIEQQKIKSINPASAINSWFGTINYFLANQDMFAQPGKIIEEKGGELIQFFLTTLRR